MHLSFFFFSFFFFPPFNLLYSIVDDSDSSFAGTLDLNSFTTTPCYLLSSLLLDLTQMTLAMYCPMQWKVLGSLWIPLLLLAF